MTCTLRTGVHMFALDDYSGDFHLTRSNVRIPRLHESGPPGVLSVNDANGRDWPPAVRHFVEDVRDRSAAGLG
eukprot:CAMPEP_0198441636 /NCGR_PEP_ID=MMETSP1452-20131203/63416_1 /TAXON_ID=1181717 /ORGANISM="Synchroma pusillum, Strain CCMP3072" /LENGTH=72 /DNA_ID=CAMNT_0044162261 /DNA_START=14 /DNA_END=228 /DNA_ORIENTATION=-